MEKLQIHSQFEVSIKLGDIFASVRNNRDVIFLSQNGKNVTKGNFIPTA